jgi:dolichol-phosphate mannosyltransferase
MTEALKRRLGPELSIIVPTRNEHENVLELVERLKRCLPGNDWEVIFVDDDSPDETAEAVWTMACLDSRVRCIQRIGRRGLSSACIEGMLASSAPYLAVIDADLQHNERLLPRMLQLLREDRADIVVGSRYVNGGGIGNWGASRATLSRLATRLSRILVPMELTDPMSGFFTLRRDVFRASVHKLSSIGFKILLDLLASSPRTPRFIELPYELRKRHAGESKLDSVAAWDYGILLLDKLVGHIVPARFVAFSVVGGAGVIAHLFILSMLFRALGLPFLEAQSIATGAAMTFNFALNNVLTYRDMRLRGWKWLGGLLSFALVCSIGALSNVGIASYLYQTRIGWFPSAVAGVVVGAVFNYAMTTAFTWSHSRKA